jgi:hypothetical protein
MERRFIIAGLLVGLGGCQPDDTQYGGGAAPLTGSWYSTNPPAEGMTVLQLSATDFGYREFPEPGQAGRPGWELTERAGFDGTCFFNDEKEPEDCWIVSSLPEGLHLCLLRDALGSDRRGPCFTMPRGDPPRCQTAQDCIDLQIPGTPICLNHLCRSQ